MKTTTQMKVTGTVSSWGRKKQTKNPVTNDDENNDIVEDD